MSRFRISLLIIGWAGLSLAAQSPDNLGAVSLVNALDNTEVTLTKYSKAPLMVVIFTSNYCPYSRKYESRIGDLHRAYKDKGVQLFLINPNSGSDDSIEEMLKKAREQDYQFPYLSDKEQRLTDLLGASRTPEAFLIRKEGLKVLYHGAIDDNPQAPDYVESSYLKSAIEAALNSRQPIPDHEKVIGCMIKKDT